MPLRLLVLISGEGTLLQAVLDAVAQRRLDAVVVAVGSDRSAPGLVRATRAGIPTFVVPLAKGADRGAWDAALADRVGLFDPDLVISAGFMKLVGPAFLARFGGRFINTHPALLPSFPGAHAVRDALAAGVATTGCTVFEVDAGIDTGPIIAQERVPVVPGDDEATLHERIKVVERRLLIDTVARWSPAACRPRQVPGPPTSTESDHDRTPPPHWPGDHDSPPPVPHPKPHARRLVPGVTMTNRRPIARALISVYDKTGLVPLGTALVRHGVEIVSTGTTARTLAVAGLPVTPVESVTGFPECLDGRVKTLHPRIHAGILADRRRPSHVAQLVDLGVEAFDLVICNLYPFAQTVASGADRDACVEQIDIGGPSMVRAAAKNHANVAVVTSPQEYDAVLAALESGGFTDLERTRLARDAFRHTAAYDVAVATWLGDQYPEEADPWPAWQGRTYELVAGLRYGENPHQGAAVYSSAGGTGLAHATQLGGKAMSYNNYTDTDAAYRACYDFDEPAVAIIKHANPCGIAVGATIAEAHAKAHACDPLSAYGGVVAANRPVTLALATALKDIFTEVIVAPAYDADALTVLQRKKNLRILVAPPYEPPATELRPISGGALVQQPDRIDAPGDDPATWTLAAGTAVDRDTLADLAFAWRAARSVKSNAILLARGGAAVGVGMGQVNRVDSCRLAVARAGERAAGSVAASDAFFPFADGPQILLDAGVVAIVEPGGSIRDDDTIAACQAAGVALYFTGTRHFFH